MDVRPPRFWQNRRHHQAVVAHLITTCPLRLSDLAPSLQNLLLYVTQKNVFTEVHSFLSVGTEYTNRTFYCTLERIYERNQFMITPQSRPKTDQPSQERRSYEVTKRKKKEGGENWIRPRYSS